MKKGCVHAEVEFFQEILHAPQILHETDTNVQTRLEVCTLNIVLPSSNLIFVLFFAAASRDSWELANRHSNGECKNGVFAEQVQTFKYCSGLALHTNDVSGIQCVYHRVKYLVFVRRNNTIEEVECLVSS